MSDGADEWEGYESGPFCRHWNDGTESCKTCGHSCWSHSDDYNQPAGCDKCECAEFVEEP